MGVAGRHVLQNLHLGIVRISNPLSSFREIVRRMRKLNVLVQARANKRLLPHTAFPLRAAVSGNFRLLDYILHVQGKPTGLISFCHHTIFDSANFFRGLLGTNVIFADVKNHVLNKFEGMIQH